MAKDEQRFILASDAGYGFICKFADLVSRNKNGKAVLNLPVGAKILSPSPVQDVASDLIAVVSNEGRMLVFPVADLPELAKGKGKIGRASCRERVESWMGDDSLKNK